MRTRKRSYSPSPPPPLFPICSSVCSSSSSLVHSSLKMSSGSTNIWSTHEDKYIEILEGICSGHDQSIGRRWDWSFWENFCIKMMSECKFQDFPNMIESCMNYCERLRKIYSQMKYPARVPPSRRSYIESIKPEYMDRLAKIFDGCRPSTSKAKKERASKLCISQPSSDDISSVNRSGRGKEDIHQVLCDMVKHGTLAFNDVEEAKGYVCQSETHLQVFLKGDNALRTRLANEGLTKNKRKATSSEPYLALSYQAFDGRKEPGQEE